MTNEKLEELRFPIGKYSSNKNPDAKTLKEWIADIEEFPNLINNYTKNLTSEELNYKYRPNGWTIKQVVHHCADSHINSYIRFKLALTEERPAIRPYFEDRWAELSDSQNDNISSSIALIKGIHTKWVEVLKNLSASDLKKEFMHPEHGETFNLAETIGTYAWHSKHHLAHIQSGIIGKGQYN